METSIVI